MERIEFSSEKYFFVLLSKIILEFLPPSRSREVLIKYISVLKIK